jgi:hypothetical protein
MSGAVRTKVWRGLALPRYVSGAGGGRAMTSLLNAVLPRRSGSRPPQVQEIEGKRKAESADPDGLPSTIVELKKLKTQLTAAEKKLKEELGALQRELALKGDESKAAEAAEKEGEVAKKNAELTETQQKLQSVKEKLASIQEANASAMRASKLAAFTREQSEGLASEAERDAFFAPGNDMTFEEAFEIDAQEQQEADKKAKAWAKENGGVTKDEWRITQEGLTEETRPVIRKQLKTLRERFDPAVYAQNLNTPDGEIVFVKAIYRVTLKLGNEYLKKGEAAQISVDEQAAKVQAAEKKAAGNEEDPELLQERATLAMRQAELRRLQGVYSNLESVLATQRAVVENKQYLDQEDALIRQEEEEAAAAAAAAQSAQDAKAAVDRAAAEAKAERERARAAKAASKLTPEQEARAKFDDKFKFMTPAPGDAEYAWYRDTQTQYQAGRQQFSDSFNPAEYPLQPYTDEELNKIFPYDGKKGTPSALIKEAGGVPKLLEKYLPQAEALLASESVDPATAWKGRPSPARMAFILTQPAYLTDESLTKDGYDLLRQTKLRSYGTAALFSNEFYEIIEKPEVKDHVNLSRATLLYGEIKSFTEGGLGSKVLGSSNGLWLMDDLLDPLKAAIDSIDENAEDARAEALDRIFTRLGTQDKFKSIKASKDMFDKTDQANHDTLAMSVVAVIENERKRLLRELPARKAHFDTWHRRYMQEYERVAGLVKQSAQKAREEAKRRKQDAAIDPKERLKQLKENEEARNKEMKDLGAQIAALEKALNAAQAGNNTSEAKKLAAKKTKFLAAFRKLESEQRESDAQLNYERTLASLQAEVSDASAKIAAAFITLDEAQKALQERLDQDQAQFNESFDDVGASCSAEPGQCGEVSTGRLDRAYVAWAEARGLVMPVNVLNVESIRTRTYNTSLDDELTQEQHDHLFLTADEAFGSSEEGEEGGMASEPPSPASEGGPSSPALQDPQGPGEGAADMAVGSPAYASPIKGAEIGVKQPTPSPVQVPDAERGGQRAIDEVEVYTTRPLAFNKGYARIVLREILMELKKMHDYSLNTLKNGAARFVDLAAAIKGDYVNNPALREQKIDETVDELLPFFEHMLRYRNTVLKAKEIQLEQELEIAVGISERAPGEKAGSGAKGKQPAAAAAAGGESRESRKANRQARRFYDEQSSILTKHAVRNEWKVEAQRMLQLQDGRIPGQLYSPQPYFLPLRIAAPPRVGKSATALLTAAIAKRLGMKVMYSVSPNKRTPIQEMLGKIDSIGWGERGAAVKRSTRGASNDGASTDNTLMNYRAYSIEDIPGRKASPDPADIDMILYSSDVSDDAMRVGAILANWRLRDVLVFHIHDEAQSFAKAEKNDIVPAHLVDVPPPPLLQYLRHYYGNMYGLICNVTATHFPTLLEEDMWGFFGSVRQNVRRGLPVSATMIQIGSEVGSRFLPMLPEALRPFVPAGYMGVEYLRTWQAAPAPGKPKEDVYLQIGANHSAKMNQKGAEAALADGPEGLSADELRAAQSMEVNAAKDAEERRKAAERAARSGAAASAGRRRKKSTAIEEDLDGETDEQRKERAEEALQDAQLTPLQLILGGDADGDGTPQSSALDTPPAPKTEDSDYSDSGSSDSEEESEATKKRKGAKSKKPKRTKADIEREKQRIRQLAEADLRNIGAHFQEWHGLEIEKDLNDIKQVAATQGLARHNIVPMHIGALNNEISDTGMASFVRYFGKAAHQNAVNAGIFGKTKTKKTPITADASRYSCLFILFTTAISTMDQVLMSNIQVVGEEGNNGRDKKAKTRLRAVKRKPVLDGERAPSPLPPESKTTAALCCIYSPVNNVATLDGEEPVFEVFLASSADFAIREAANYKYQSFSTPVRRVSILGYGMLEAGLTVQVYIPPNEVEPIARTYCPKYLALATSAQAALDAQLQIAGRSFVEIKGQVAPTTEQWQVQMLGVKNAVKTLVEYSGMESLLSKIKPVRMYQALKDPEVFDNSLIAKQKGKNKLGVVGVRRGDFGQILGLTAATAQKRADEAEKRKAAKKAEEASGSGGAGPSGTSPPPAPPPAPGADMEVGARAASGASSASVSVKWGRGGA